MHDLTKAKTINLTKINTAIEKYIEEFGYDDFIKETTIQLGCKILGNPDVGYDWEIVWPIKGGL